VTHEEMDDVYELYVLGVLEPEAARDIDEHLGDQCDYCLQHLRDAVLTTAGIAGVAPSVKPPRALRKRVLQSVTPRPRLAVWKFWVGALAAACVVLLSLFVWKANTAEALRDQVASLSRQRDQLQSVVLLLSRPDTKAVQFGVADNKPHGRVFLNANAGVVFIGSNLPQVSDDQTLELWVIPKTGAPEPAGLFKAGANGDSVDVWNEPVDVAQSQAVAVTVEPKAGSAKPTTQPFLVVPVG
jgi:anti-sigma-K factor RskA